MSTDAQPTSVLLSFSAIAETDFAQVEKELHETLTMLKWSKDASRRRVLLLQMRFLLAVADQLIGDMQVDAVAA